jgi:peptidoglycan/LPS O-acetylase OafA/YrhL
LFKLRVSGEQALLATVSPDLDQSRIKVLDGLRALAIMLVIMHHGIRMISSTDLSTPFTALGTFLKNGRCGVDLFFVLSGFLIARQLLAGDTILHFYRKRFLRIAPVYYVILTLACLGLFPSFPRSDPAHVWGWRYVYHLLFLQDVFYPDIIPLFWSLAIECQFYIVAPFLVGVLLLLNRRERYGLFAMAALLSVSIRTWAALRWFPQGTDDWQTYYWIMQEHFPFRLDGFIVGMLSAFLWRDEDARRLLERPTVANALFWGGLGLLISLTGFSVRLEIHVGLFDEIFLTPLLSVAFGTMMLGLLGGCYGHRLFTARPLGFIALISYSLYLIHTTLISTIEQAVHAAMPESHPVLQWLVFLIPYLCLSVLLGTISYFAIERPCIRWSRK